MPSRLTTCMLGTITLAVMLITDLAAQNGRLDGPLEVRPLRHNLTVLTKEPAGNVLVSAGDDGVLLIDAQFAAMSPRILDAVGTLTDQPVRYLFNTHWHRDHTGGNRNLAAEGVTIIAHDNVRKRLSSEQFHLQFKARSAPRPEEALPVLTFSNTFTLYFNGDVMDVVHVPAAHTDSDTIYYFRNADVMHTGDAFINHGYPLIDVAGGGTIKGQIEATQRMIDLAGPQTIVVSGHGPLTDRARLIEVRDMLIEARQQVVTLLEQGKTLEEIKAARPLAKLDPVWEKSFPKSAAFTTIIYQSETGDWKRPD